MERFKVCFSRKAGEGGKGKAIRKISRLYQVFSIEGFPKGDWASTSLVDLKELRISKSLEEMKLITNNSPCPLCAFAHCQEQHIFAKTHFGNSCQSLKRGGSHSGGYVSNQIKGVGCERRGI